MDELSQKDYELSFLARDEKGAEAVLNLLKKWGAEITLEGPFERVALAYKIAGALSAYLGYFHLRLTPDKVQPLSQDLRAKGVTLRFLIITPPFVKGRVRPAGKSKTMRPAPIAPPERRPASLPISNEALERTIEEILK